MSLRDTILAHDDLKRRELKVDEWGETIHVREMTVKEKSWLMGKHDKAKSAGQTTIENLEAEIAARVVVDEHGKQVFELRDASALAEKSNCALNKIVQVCFELSEFGAKNE